MSKSNYDVIVVGTGPTGIFTVMELLKQDGYLDILMLEKGKDISERDYTQGQAETIWKEILKKSNTFSVNSQEELLKLLKKLED